MSHKAFTLIELLIVVAIIAILAAIAVPNFLEAQVRAKASRAKADMRSIATAMESYSVDYNDYPMDFFDWLDAGRLILGNNNWTPLSQLSTPIAYLSSVPDDPFPERQSGVNNPQSYLPLYHHLWTSGWTDFTRDNNSVWPVPKYEWVLWSYGPDRVNSRGGVSIFSWELALEQGPIPTSDSNAGAIYDSTNGTMSSGDIVRVGP